MKKAILSLLQALKPKCNKLSFRERRELIHRHWARNGYGNRPRAIVQKPDCLGERLNQLFYSQTIKAA